MSWLRLKFFTFHPSGPTCSPRGADAFLLETPGAKLTIGLSPLAIADSSFFGFPNVPEGVERWDHLSLTFLGETGRLRLDHYETSPDARHYSAQLRGLGTGDQVLSLPTSHNPA